MIYKKNIYHRINIIAFSLFVLIINISRNTYSQCTITCPPDTNFFTLPGVNYAITDTLLPFESGGCMPGFTYTLSGSTAGSGDTVINDTFNLGLTKVTYTIDGHSCSFNVNVLDMEPPEIEGVENISTTANPNDCGAQIYFDLPTITDNTEDVTPIVQYFDFNASSIDNLTSIGWKFENISLFPADTCLRSNTLSTSDNFYSTSPFYYFNSDDSVFFVHWITDPSGPNTDSLKLYLINTNNDTALIFSYASLIADIKNTDTIVISTSGFYRLHFVYQTESGGTARGFLDNIFVQGIYAHNINLENIIEPVEALRIFQLDSTYISGDVFPIGKTVIQYKIIDNYGNYSLKEFTITISGGGNIISGNSIVDENTVHLYTTTSGMTNYNWTITGGIEYDGNGDDSIYIFWNSGPNGHVRVSYDNGPTHVISCNFSVAINDIDYGCFEYKRKLTINSALVMADLENFPVLVYTTLPEFKHTSYGGHISHFNGYDISFSTDSNGFNILPHQLDYYEPSTGKIAIWVMFSELDGDANTNFYMHYGNSNIDRDISNDTIWSSDWVGVFHMGQSLNDYGRGNNNSVNYGTDQVDGKVGKARRFRRTDKDYISIINKTPFSFTTSMTVSFWIYLQSYPTASGVDWTDIIIKGDNQNWRFVGNKSTQRMCYAFNLGGEGFDTYSDNNSFTTGHWYYVAGTWESQNDSYQANNIKKLFFNGDINTQDPSHTPNNSISDDSDFDPNDPVIFGINNDATDTRSFDGMMDEIRLANTYRNDAWLQTDFNTQSNPGSFITFSEEESGTVVSSIGGFADIDQDTIYAREFVTGNLTGQIGTIQWQWSSDKSTFYDIEGATSSSFLSEPVLEDTYIRALVSNRGCAKSSTIDSVSVIAGFITCEYNFRRELVISPDSVDGTDDLLNFPFLIEFNQPYMRDTVHGGDVINSSGWDIIFTSSNGISIIPHEVDVYDPVTGHYRAWVKIPRLKSTDTTYFYMYYGKEGVITNPSTRSPWSSEYIGVWHLENNCRDTVGTNEGTVTSGTASYSTAKIGNGINMNGVTVTIANESNFDIPADKAITISGWFNISSFSSSNQPLISKGTDAWELRRYGTNPYGEFIIELDGSGKYYSAQGNTSFLSGWKYICASYDDLSRQYVIYVNGVLASATNDPADPKNRLTNNTPITFRSFLGYLDELRIANVYRSIDWIKTEYRNQMNPDSMFLVREPRQFCVANPVGGTTFSDDTVVCKGRNAVIILSNSDGNVYWQQSADSIDWEFMLGETDTILVTDVLSDTMFYRAVVSEECCSDYSEIIQINFKNQNPPDLNIFVNNIACAGDDNGIIDIVPSTDDYLYHWSTNATTEDITNLEPGTYSVTVVDTSSKCNLKENRTINESERINITLSDLDDVTCNGNDGAINIAVAGGTLPYLINFDSIHYVKIGDNDSLDNLINIEGSIEVRFKTKDTTRQGSILYKGSNSSNHSYDISLTEDSLIFIYSYSGGTHTLSWDSIEINQWYHVAIDWDENNLRMYINGDLKDYEGKTGHNLDATNDSLYIGKKGIHPNSSREYFWGNIKDVRIWNRSRTKENITDSMKIPLLGSESGLLAYYPMDEHNQDSIFNNTTNENIHGQIYPTSNITWIASTYEYLWSNDILVQDIISLDTGYYSVTVSDIYGCFETRQFYVDFDDAIKVAPTSPLVTIEGLRFGAGPQILKVKGPYNNCPDSAVRYVWYIEDIPGTQTINNKSDSLLVVYQGSSQTYYVASVNFAGTESETRTSVPAALNALDSNYRALHLPGLNDYALVSPHGSYQPHQQISVEAWVYFSNLDNGAAIFKNGWDNSHGVRIYYNSSSSTLRFEVNSASNYVESEIDSNKWIHITATYDNEKIKLYLNGLAVDSANYNSNISYSADSIFLGNQFRGYIDDLRIWDTCLTNNHIKTLMFQILEPNIFDNDVYDGLNMRNLKFYCHFNNYSLAGKIAIPVNYLYPLILRNNAAVTNNVPFDNWFPLNDNNWHTASNWFSGSIPNTSSPEFAVINSDTAQITTDAYIKGLVLKQNASVQAPDDNLTKLTINGDLYNADIVLNAVSTDSIEVYSSIGLQAQLTSETYLLGNIPSNAFQNTVMAKGLRVFYFEDDTLSSLQYSSIDTIIDFNWGTDSINEFISNDGNYSILWVGQIQGPVTDNIDFYITTEGISELWIDNELVVSATESGSPEEFSGTFSMSADEWYIIMVVFRQISDSASIQLEWDYSGSREIIPANYLKPYNGLIFE